MFCTKSHCLLLWKKVVFRKYLYYLELNNNPTDIKMFVCQYFKWFFNLFSKRNFGYSRPVAVNRTFKLFSQDAPDVYSDRVGLTFSQVKKSFPPSDWIPCIACEGKQESSLKHDAEYSSINCVEDVWDYTWAGWKFMLGLGRGVHFCWMRGDAWAGWRGTLIRSGPPQTDPHKWTSTNRPS